MTKLILGDFRTRQLQNYKNSADDEQLDFDFVFSDDADYSWFSNVATTQINYSSSELKHVIIALGFNDCVYSAIFSSFKLNKIADDYSNLINSLIEQNGSINFYFCSINPVQGNYPFAVNNTTNISKDKLNSNIELFNNRIKENCKATFIDSYSYLTTTNMDTYDGIRYLFGTCCSILSYININLKTTSGFTFIKRTEAPNPNSNDIESDMFWVNTSYSGGLNVFATAPLYKKSAGDVLPNCVSYAWGRWYEILRTAPKLSTHNAEYWYIRDGSGKYKTYYPGEDDDDGYERGQEPKVGAVICWQAGEIGGKGANDAGHVGIVEEVLEDGSIITSESGYETKDYWWVKKRDKNGYWKGHYDNNGNFVADSSYQKVSNGNWGAGSSYKFQGFIYCPVTTASPNSVDVNKEDVVIKSGSLKQEEMEINAKYIWKYLGGKENKDERWTLNAVAGILGNMQHESAINPGRHESSGSGFGLVQWTPKSKYTNWATAAGYTDETDIDGQLERIIAEKENGWQYTKKHYKYTFKEFSKSEDDPYTLACAFAWDYEKSGVTQWGFHSNTYKSNYCRYTRGSSECKNNCVGCRECYSGLWGAAQTEKQAEKNKQALRDLRGNSAKNWFEFLLPFSPDFGPKFAVSDFKLDSISSVYICASFLVVKGKSGYYNLYASDGSLIYNKRGLNVEHDEKDKSKIITFKCDKLIPNKKYKLEIVITGDSGENKTLAIEFMTKQEYPEANLNIVLTPENLAMPDQRFKLSITGTSKHGYWGKNDSGFIIQSIVNGKKQKEKIISSPSSDNFILAEHELFKDIGIKIGDTVQIGLNAWVKDDNGNIIFDNTSPQTSNSICLLEKPTITYLNN